MALIDQIRERLQLAETPSKPGKPGNSRLQERALPMDALTFGWDLFGETHMLDVTGMRYAPTLLFFDQPAAPARRHTFHWVPVNGAAAIGDWEFIGIGHIWQDQILTGAALFREVQ